jgi:beta-phosphoglucomutase-like phosphatase (HAD superfamily)
MTMRRFRAVLLDIDGTLVDSNDAHALAWHDAFAEHDLAIAPARIRRLIGMGGEFLVATVAPAERNDAIDARHGETFRQRSGMQKACSLASTWFRLTEQTRSHTIDRCSRRGSAASISTRSSSRSSDYSIRA